MTTFFAALTTIVLPILLVSAVAFGIAKAGIVTEQRPLARLSLYLFSPALAFESVANSNVSAAEFATVLVHVLLVAIVMGALGLVIARVFRFDRLTTSAFLLSIIFVNAGNYGLPFVQFAFGAEGVARAAIYFVGNSVLMSTLAVYIASAGHSDLRRSLSAVVRMPLTYAAVLGLTFNTFNWALPLPVARAVELAGAAALPVMLVNLGLELARARFQDYDWRVFFAAGLKLLVTPIIAFGLAGFLGLQGLTRTVSIIQASMPTAVIVSLLAVEFRARSDLVTSVVFISTLASLVTLTILLLILGYSPG